MVASRTTYRCFRSTPPWLSWAPLALLATAVCVTALRTIVVQCGHAAVPLDDAYIHLQYARRLATGHFFSYTGTDGYSSGATSLLWPALLAPAYAIGLHGHALIWVAWVLSWLALLGLAVETCLLAEKLAGSAAAYAAGAMVLCFGGYAWFASSGMEAVPFAYLLAATGRRAAEWGEAEASARSPKKRRALLLLAVFTPLMRPEGALVSAMVAATLMLFRSAAPDETWSRRLPWAVAACLGGFGPSLINLLLTGRAMSSTTAVKWLPANPYYRGADLDAAVTYNLRLLVGTLLDGREWSAVFLPTGSRPFALASLLAIPITGWTRSRRWRSVVVLLLALGIGVPCTYLTFLWNRVRYIWPFAFAWFIGAACLATLTAEVLAVVRPRFRALSGVMVGLAAGGLLGRMGWSIDDVAASASAIDRQQVKLGLWADQNLPKDVTIGVNDTGAIAYFGNRHTFDLVGLTTPSEAPYWVAGAGSRFEHYERLYRESPGRLPTHFIVYPGWMGLDALLGPALHEATVLNQTILGGNTMIAYRARYDLLGSGDRPTAPPETGLLLDELDVSDLESERAHRYRLGATRETENVALHFATEDDSREIADGARTHRSFDEFTLDAAGTRGSVLAGRWTASSSTALEVVVNGTRVGAVEVADDDCWTEATFAIPENVADGPLSIGVRAPGGGHFGSAHYWLYRVPQVAKTVDQ